VSGQPRVGLAQVYRAQGTALATILSLSATTARGGRSNMVTVPAK